MAHARPGRLWLGRPLALRRHEKNDLELAEWCLAHGANPNAEPERDQQFSRYSLYEHAVRSGHEEMAELLARHGAERVAVELDDEDRFVAAALRLDGKKPGASSSATRILQSTKAIFAGAKRDRADVVEFLLDLGTPSKWRTTRSSAPCTWPPPAMP